MGIAPDDLKKMTVWEFVAVMDHWMEAHDSKDDRKKLSDGEAKELWTWMQSRQSPLTLKEAREKKNGAGR
jgi:hypothetical protein